MMVAWYPPVYSIHSSSEPMFAVLERGSLPRLNFEHALFLRLDFMEISWNQIYRDLLWGHILGVFYSSSTTPDICRPWGWENNQGTSHQRCSWVGVMAALCSTSVQWPPLSNFVGFSMPLGMSFVRVFLPYFDPLIKFSYAQIWNFLNVWYITFVPPTTKLPWKISRSWKSM